MDVYLPCFYGFVACMAVCIVFNVRGKRIFLPLLAVQLAGLYIFYSVHYKMTSYNFFIATVAITVYSEIMARIHKVPVTGYLLIALLPMVPGGGIYYTMEYCIAGNTQMFLETGLHTLGIAGALALGILLVSSLNRLWGMSRSGKGG